MKQIGVSALPPDRRSARLWRVLVLLAASPEDESGKSVTTSVCAENLVVEFDWPRTFVRV